MQALADAEGWTTLRDHPEDGLRAWEASWPTLVAVSEGELVGFARALTDGSVTMYLADLLVAPAWRGRGVGAALLAVCHQLYPNVRIDLLSTGAAQGFYEADNFRPFPGFRKSYW